LKAKSTALYIQHNHAHWTQIRSQKFNLCSYARINIKFLVLQIDNHLNLKIQTDEIIPELCGACYAVWSMFHISNFTTLKFTSHTFMLNKVWNNFWGGNSCTHGKTFTVQKQTIRIMVGAWPRTPCISLFRDRHFTCSIPVYLYIFTNELNCKWKKKFQTK
jgi:hypothetical protein